MKNRKVFITATMGMALAGVMALTPAMNSMAAPASERGNGIGYQTTNDGLDIFGITDDSNHVRTTYYDEGYMTAVSLDGGNTTYWLGDGTTFEFENPGVQIGTFYNGRVYDVDGVKVSVTAGLNNTGDCVILSYSVTNNTSSDKTVLLGTFGDTMIMNSDRNCRLAIDNGRISFYHPTEDYGFAFATDQDGFDTMYVGHYHDAHDGVFTNSATMYNNSVDSGIAYSWRLSVPAGATVNKATYNALGDTQYVIDIIDNEIENQNQNQNAIVIVVVTDWLEELRTQLKIAADPEIGANVNNTVNYTGTYALPYEFMQFIKDHPEVTLNYSFYVGDELKTVTINGANVIADENIPWYGFNYLLSNYGAGAAVTATVPTTPDVAAVPVSAYTIVSGDTLTGIASKLGSSVEALAAFNGINNVDLIYAGNTIFYC